MPIYEYHCQLCGEISDHHVPMDSRLERQDCPSCNEFDCAEFRVTAPLIGTERLHGESRVIHTEKQLPKHWRDEGTTGKPGGAGRKIHFHD